MSVLLRAGVALLVAGSATAEEPGDPAKAGLDPGHPVTIERVWYRATRGYNVFKPFGATGDLTVSGDGVTFHTKKKTIEIPLEKIHAISFGQLKGDVDTDWALLGVGTTGPEQIIGFRDGRKAGYGLRTERIYELLRDVLKGARAAQYAAPSGFEVFDDFGRQFTLAIPEGWTSYLQSLVYVNGEARYGTVVFSVEPIRRRNAEPGGDMRLEADETALKRVLDGDTAAIFVERREVPPGMSCSDLKKKAQSEIVSLLADDLLFAKGGHIDGEPTSEPAAVGRCHALRLEARGTRSDGAAARLAVYAVAHDEILYLFGLRTLAESYEDRWPAFETALSTVRFSVAH